MASWRRHEKLSVHHTGTIRSSAPATRASTITPGQRPRFRMSYNDAANIRSALACIKTDYFYSLKSRRPFDPSQQSHSSDTFDHNLGVAAARGKDQGAVVYHISSMDAGRVEDLPSVPPPTNDPGAFSYNSFRRFLPVMGIVAASSAITGLAAGTATPAAGFGLFVLLLGGLSLVTLSVLGA